MKRLLAIVSVSLFVVCISAKDITALAWQIWYQVNQEYVARELCVNKAKPQMQCNGKCHLMKQLRKLEEPTSKSVNQNSGTKKSHGSVLKLKTPDWISATDRNTSKSVIFQDLNKKEWPELKRSLTFFSSSVFRPPTAA